MIVGVKEVICTCGKDMIRTGGVFGGEQTTDTYYCRDCQKHIIVVTPRQLEQDEFATRISHNVKFNY